MIKTVGVYIVDTTADKPEPNFLRDSRNKPSAINIPRNPLNASVKISCWEKLGEGIEKRTIVKKKPKTILEILVFGMIYIKFRIIEGWFGLINLNLKSTEKKG